MLPMKYCGKQSIILGFGVQPKNIDNFIGSIINELNDSGYSVRSYSNKWISIFKDDLFLCELRFRDYFSLGTVYFSENKKKIRDIVFKEIKNVSDSSER